jgi:hypothetical protein
VPVCNNSGTKVSVFEKNSQNVSKKIKEKQEKMKDEIWFASTVLPEISKDFIE